MIDILLTVFMQFVGGVFMMITWKVNIKKIGFSRWFLGWVVGTSILTSNHEIVQALKGIF